MLDDIKDGPDLWRGNPATHTIFSIARTLNLGCYQILQTVQDAKQLLVPGAIDIVLEEWICMLAKATLFTGNITAFVPWKNRT